MNTRHDRNLRDHLHLGMFLLCSLEPQISHSGQSTYWCARMTHLVIFNGIILLEYSAVARRPDIGIRALEMPGGRRGRSTGARSERRATNCRPGDPEATSATSSPRRRRPIRSASGSNASKTISCPASRGCSRSVRRSRCSVRHGSRKGTRIPGLLGFPEGSRGPDRSLHAAGCAESVEAGATQGEIAMKITLNYSARLPSWYAASGRMAGTQLNKIGGSTS